MNMWRIAFYDFGAKFLVSNTPGTVHGTRRSFFRHFENGTLNQTKFFKSRPSAVKQVFFVYCSEH